MHGLSGTEAGQQQLATQGAGTGSASCLQSSTLAGPKRVVVLCTTAEATPGLALAHTVEVALQM